jgi:apolipoprotein N-acyltransferase
MSETPPTYDVRAAQAAIDADRQWRAEEAARRIQLILEELRCRIEALPGLSPDGRIVATPRIVAE